MDEMELRVIALETLVWELLLMVPEAARRPLVDSASADLAACDGESTMMRQILAHRREILTRGGAGRPGVASPSRPLRVQPDNDDRRR